MYIPPHQFSIKTASEIGNLLDSSGQPFIGQVLQVADGRYFKYAEQLLNGNFKTAETLNKAPESPTLENIDTIYTANLSDIPKGTLEISRYFIKNTSTGDIKEHTKAGYLARQRDVKSYEQFGELNWKVEGTVETLISGSIVIESVVDQNKAAVETLNTTLPGILNKIQDYTTLVRELVPPPGFTKLSENAERFKYIPAPSRL